MTRPPALEFLLSRRSRPVRTLAAPVPDREALMTLLTAAARVPDHGKLEPWRFVVLGRPALARLADLAAARASAAGLEAEAVAKARAQFDESPLCVAVIGCPRATDRIPAIEQTLSAGAVCLSLVNAALAAGWGACWLTGFAAYDPAFRSEGLGLSGSEWVAGFVHIGTATSVPSERPRPDLGRLVTWADA
jgi:nitroreductase